MRESGGIMRLIRLASLGFLWVTALVSCGDPILDKVESDEAGPAQPIAGRDVPPEGVGIPEEPAPGVPGEPSPGLPGSPQEGTPGEHQPGKAGAGNAPVNESETTLIKGEVVFSDYSSGIVRLDVFDGDQTDFALRPSVVAMEQLAKPEPFELRVPMSTERVWLSAFNDANTNGRPDPQDPTGFYAKNPLDVSGGGVVEGVVILLEVREPPEHQKGEW